MRKAVIRSSDNFVENIIEIQEDSTWEPSEGFYLKPAENCSPGDSWDGEKFIKSEPPEPKLIRDLAAEIDDLKARVDALTATLSKA